MIYATQHHRCGASATAPLAGMHSTAGLQETRLQQDDHFADRCRELPLFRNTDPDTSRDAGAAAGEWRDQHEALILEALAIGPAGKTTIGVRTGLTDQQVIRRMADLRRKNAVKPTGARVLSRAGRREAEWRLA